MALALRYGPGRRPTPAGWGLLGVIYLAIWVVGWFGYQAAVGYEQRLRALEDTPWAKTAATIAAGSQGLVPRAVLDASWVRALQAPYTRARDGAETAGQAVTWWLAGFLTLCGVLVGLTWFTIGTTRAVGYALLMTALPALAVGVFAPLLMIKATLFIGPLPVLLQFESKSIIGSIGALFGRGQVLLGAAVVAFSVLIPTVKTLVLLVLAGRPRASRESHLHRFVHLLGPWSMAEVFVVAALLVFFGSDGAGNTAAEIEPGTWYFLSYVLMSVTASLLL
jgi:paraquat-inducible protein A